MHKNSSDKGKDGKFLKFSQVLFNRTYNLPKHQSGAVTTELRETSGKRRPLRGHFIQFSSFVPRS